jgi:putative salt-induced outer membrane protein
MKRNCSRLLLAVFLFLPLLRVSASEVTLKNGDRVSGTIVEQTDETVVLETEYAGKISINRKHIETIGEGLAAADVTLKLAPAAKPAAPAVKPAAAKASKARLFGGRNMGIADGWEGNANIGFNYTSGNSNTTTMSTGLRAVKAGGRDNLTVYARSLWHSSHGNGRVVTTQNAFWGGARYDRNIGEKTFGFVSYDFERDRPKKLDFRSVAGGGVGHHTIKDERTQLDLLFGAAWNRTWQPGKNTDTPEALIGSTLKHKFHDRLRLQKSFTYFQNVTDAKEYRYLFDATLSADVTKRIGVFVTLGDRFNNDPLGTSKKNDLLITTGMKWNFGRKR